MDEFEIALLIGAIIVSLISIAAIIVATWVDIDIYDDCSNSNDDGSNDDER